MKKKLINNEETIELPTEVEIIDVNDEEESADYLSDTYGWCVNSFEIETTK